MSIKVSRKAPAKQVDSDGNKTLLVPMRKFQSRSVRTGSRIRLDHVTRCHKSNRLRRNARAMTLIYKSKMVAQHQINLIKLLKRRFKVFAIIITSAVRTINTVARIEIVVARKQRHDN